MNDGQGISYGSQGVPYAVEAVNAPAGSDAAAILAFSDPTNATYGTAPIDLEFQLPPSVCVAAGGDGPNFGWIAFGVLALLLLVRR